VLSAVVRRSLPGPLTSCCSSRVCTAGVSPVGSCLQQLTRTVTMVHGSPPVRRANRDAMRGARGHAKPSRVDSGVTVGTVREATRVATGTAGLSMAPYCPPPGFPSRGRLRGNERRITQETRDPPPDAGGPKTDAVNTRGFMSPPTFQGGMWSDPDTPEVGCSLTVSALSLCKALPGSD
jgi:hypothetical protein